MTLSEDTLLVLKRIERRAREGAYANGQAAFDVGYLLGLIYRFDQEITAHIAAVQNPPPPEPKPGGHEL